jgi:hypothetical protein
MLRIINLNNVISASLNVNIKYCGQRECLGPKYYLSVDIRAVLDAVAKKNPIALARN